MTTPRNFRSRPTLTDRLKSIGFGLGVGALGVLIVLVILAISLGIFIWAIVVFIQMMISGVTEGWNAGNITWAIISGIVILLSLFSSAKSSSR